MQRGRRQQHHNRALTLRFTERLATLLDNAARASDRTRSEFVREVLRRELARDLYSGGVVANGAGERTR
jgi:uncharacterized protein (DUF1778 family)